MARRRDRSTVRPTYYPPDREIGQHAGTLVLRDGSRLALARALPEHSRQVEAFLKRLPEDDRSELLSSLKVDRPGFSELLERLHERVHGGAYLVHGPVGEKIVAFGAYRLLAALRDTASVGIAVAPELRRMGIASLLLERVAVLAARQGVSRIVGTTRFNRTIPEGLLRAGGFEPDIRHDEASASFLISTGASVAGPGTRRISSRTFAAVSLRPLFEPSSVAVVGGSIDRFNLVERITASLVRARFNGPVYPVVPGARHVLSIRAYPSVASIAEGVDMAVVAVPSNEVPQVVEACSRAGVRVLVVVSSGFSESGAEGRDRERALVEQVRRHGMRLVGPNCMGVIHAAPEIRLNASLSSEMPEPGSTALCSQSGALGVAITALSRRLGLGLSSFVAIGNRADVTGNDLLEYWEEDARTRVILFYLESFGNPRRFARLARRVGRAKPIVTVKASRTTAGRRSVDAHDESVAWANLAVDALFNQTGVIRAETLEEMFGIARALADQPLPRGRRVAILTNAGGPAILCADALVGSGLRVEPLSKETQRVLAGMLPPTASTTNPVDMLASCRPEVYRRAVEIMLSADEVDVLVVIHTPVGLCETSEVGLAVVAGVEGARASSLGTGKPVVASIVGEEPGCVMLQGADGLRIPVYPFPEAVGRLMSKVADYAEWRRADPGVFPEYRDQRLGRVRQRCQQLLERDGPGWVPAADVRQVLASAGLIEAPGGVARSASSAVRQAEEIGFPVVLKLASDQIVNKADQGGVRLGIESAAGVRSAFAEIRESFADRWQDPGVEGVLVQPMLSASAEVTIRVSDDPRFGPLISFGLAGMHWEVLGDAAHRVSPLTDADARSMIRQIAGYQLLTGYRGHPPADVEALEEALLRISCLVEAVPQILKLELKPVFVMAPGDGYRIGGAGIRLQHAERGGYLAGRGP